MISCSALTKLIDYSRPYSSQSRIFVSLWHTVLTYPRHNLLLLSLLAVLAILLLLVLSLMQLSMYPTTYL